MWTDARHAFVFLLDAETGLRGYRLTGCKVFLEPYQKAQHALLETLVLGITSMCGAQGKEPK